MEQLSIFDIEPDRFEDQEKYAKYWIDRQRRLFGSNTNSVAGLTDFVKRRREIKMSLGDDGWFKTIRI